MLIAVTREISPAIVRCELTHLDRTPIDIDLARAQHRAYERALEEAGCTIVRVEAAPDLPDAVFVEDAAVVLDELAVIMRPGAESRRAETPAVADLVGRYRPLRHHRCPRYDRRRRCPRRRPDGVHRPLGADQRGRRRADAHDPAAARLRGPRRCGDRLPASQVGGYGACRRPAARQPRRGHRRDAFPSFGLVDIDPREPYAANIVRAGGALIYPAAFPRTCERLERLGFRVRTVEVGELAKAEGAVTCCSLIFDAPSN